MSTNRDVVSNVRSTHKLLNGDSLITDRAILFQLRQDAFTLINQRANRRKGWTTDTLFTPLDCLELETVPLGTCCNISSDAKVSRSVHKLPKILEGNYNYLIQGVYDVEVGRELKYMTIKRYLNTLKLNLKKPDVYFWIHDGHLFVSSEGVKVAKIVAAFEGDIPRELLFPECDCGQIKKDPCKSPLDDDFKCPGDLIGTAVRMTSNQLLQTYFSIQADKTDNNLDETRRG